MVMLNTNEIENARQKAATTDMRRARKNGVLAITDTTQGVVELSYADGTYTLARMATYSQTGCEIATGKAAQVKPALAALYTVS